MLALMFLLHLIADYTLQGCLANLKQRKWWEDRFNEEKDEKKKSELRSKYRNDYEAALWCHGMYWSLVVCLPLLMAGGIAYAVNALIHGFSHALIDHAKANRFSLNLIQDQLLHGMQILCIWMVWTWFLCILRT